VLAALADERDSDSGTPKQITKIGVARAEEGMLAVATT